MRLSFGLILFIWIASLSVALGLKTYWTDQPQKVAVRALASFSDSRSVQPRVSADFCEHGENYNCEWRVFGPQESDSSTIVHKCVALIGVPSSELASGPSSGLARPTSSALPIEPTKGDLCLTVLKIMFRNGDLAGAGGEGQVANAVKCSLQGAAFAHDASIDAETSDVESAVALLHSKCQDSLAEHL